MNKPLSEVLFEPAKWTQGEFARDMNGKPIDPSNSLACCYCLLGALAISLDCDANEVDNTAHKNKRKEKSLLLTVIRNLVSNCKTSHPSKRAFHSIESFNDHPHTTFEDIQKVAEEYDRRMQCSNS